MKKEYLEFNEEIKIPKSLNWDLSHMFSSHDEWERVYNVLDKNINVFKKFKNKLNDEQNLIKYFKFTTSVYPILDKMSAYVSLSIEINNNLEQAIIDKEKLENLNYKIDDAMTYINKELKKFPDEKLKKMISNKKYYNYREYLYQLLYGKKSVLTAKEQKILNSKDFLYDSFKEMYDAIISDQLDFGLMNIEGKHYQITSNDIASFLHNKNESTRKHFYEIKNKAYGKINKLVSMNYINFVKYCCSDLDLNKQESYLNECLERIQVSPKVYDNLIKNVRKNLPSFHAYQNVCKKYYPAKQYGLKDINLDIRNYDFLFYDFDFQKKIIIDSLDVLGEEYKEIIKAAFDNNWIHITKPEEQKQSCYCRNVYASHPYIYLYNNNCVTSVSTLAHELGHAAFEKLSAKYQPYATHRPHPFIDEVASITNELLLEKHLIKTAKWKEDRMFLLSSYIEKVNNTFFLQTMLSEFEDFAFKNVENAFLTADMLNDKYLKLTKEYYGNIEILDSAKYEWERIPHFYLPYYVFQYATGYVCANKIANGILAGDEELKNNYLQFLKCGSCAPPEYLLKSLGIDLTKNAIYKEAIADYNKAVKQYETYAEELQERKNKKSENNKRYYRQRILSGLTPAGLEKLLATNKIKIGNKKLEIPKNYFTDYPQKENEYLSEISF